MSEHFMEFGSLEDAFSYMRQATAEANATLTAAQRGLTWGSYWVRPYEGIAIFGYVMTPEENERSEREAGAEPEELRYAMQRLRDSHEDGYLFGWAYSVWEPRGELGSTHRANAWPITQAQFETAQDAAWDHLQPSVAEWLYPLSQTWG